MKRTLVTLVGALLLVVVPVLAQSQNVSAPEGQRLGQTVASLAKALNSDNAGLQASAAETIRELKTAMPAEEFTSLVIPLMRVVKDENAQVESRILAALALHDLNSPIGDYAIKGMARFSSAPRFQHVCTSLVIDRNRQILMAKNAKREQEDSKAMATARLIGK